MKTNFETLGVIGFGSFGSLIPRFLPEEVPIQVYDINSQPTSDRIEVVESVSDLAKNSAIIMAVPLKSYPDVLGELACSISPDSLLVDICSVKVEPTKLIDKYLGDHPNLLLTHPLFGVNSLTESPDDLDLITTRVVGDKASFAVQYCQNELGLNIIESTAEEHDETMALTHSLGFFISAAIKNMLPENPRFAPPSYKKLVALSEVVSSQESDLFQTIEKGNPFASTVRRQIIESMVAIDEGLA